MITLYGAASSPNVLKVRLMLEEAGIPYQEKRVKREEGENLTPEFLEISATGTLPAVVDEQTGATIFESSAILLYLASSSGKFLSTDPAARADVYKWLIFEAANISPAIESMYKLMYLAEEWTEAAIDFHRQKLAGSIALLNKQLATSDYIAGDCSIADFALFPLANILEDFLEQSLSEYPCLQRWCERMKQRPAVQRASSGATPV